MEFHRLQPISRFVVALMIAVATSGCVSTAPKGGGKVATSGGGEVRQIDDLVLVDCLLPGQIRQLGTRMTYLAPRRRVKATKSDCGIRGGEFVLFDRSDYSTALQTLLPKAQGGDAVAQTYVGEIYEKGLGLAAPDYASAALWYRKAATSGYSPAQTNLGSLYERGLGVRKDKAQALNWYRQSAGLTGDTLTYESKLEAQRAAFRREIAVRNSIASSLRRQLSQRSGSGQTEVARAQKSFQRDTASATEQRTKEIHAVQEVKKAEGLDKGGSSSSGKKAAHLGKLELSLRQERDALMDTQRLAGT